MFALKLMILLVAMLVVTSSPVSDGSNQPPSTTENKLPLESNQYQNKHTDTIHTEEKHDEVLTTSDQEIAKPHRLMKRFINPRWGYDVKRNSPSDVDIRSVWSMSDGEFGDPDNIANSPYKEDVLNLLRGLSKPKRYFGLLPAKELRRKDLPPRLGEESAPRFARTFTIPGSVKEKRLPSVRTSLNDLFMNYGGLEYDPQPLDYTERQSWGQTVHIDTPININNIDVDIGVATNYSYVDSNYSEKDLADYSNTTYDLQKEDEDETENSLPTSKDGELDKFKNNLIKLASVLQGLTRRV